MTSIVWFRRDLRLHDHAALRVALQAGDEVQPVFIFDTDILKDFANPTDRRLTFIADTLADMHHTLQKRGGGLLVLHGRAQEIMPKLAKALGASGVYAAQDFEQATMARDVAVGKSVSLHLVKDHVIFAPDEILKDDGSPYKVFTPYSKAWMARLSPSDYGEYVIADKGRYAPYDALCAKAKAAGLTLVNLDRMLADIGYERRDIPEWPVTGASARLKKFIQTKVVRYKDQRDMLAEEGTSQISPYLRFGLVSIRECMRAAISNVPSPPWGRGQGEGEGRGSKTWINELIWREFYAMILYHYPESVDHEWNASYRGLPWSWDEDKLEAWKQGKTGYPVVDAAMRQLLTTGWMHNRARMIVASFLTKDLLIDWRAGEAHFAQYLMDYELASNVGGWQWAASTGTDAQPYFRIFNPYLQSQKFDPKGDYIRRYVPELTALSDKDIHEPPPLLLPKGYPAPIVEHSVMRDKALSMFKSMRDER